jgi:hypothetical protein
VDPNGDVYFGICGDERETFDGIAIQLVQETYDVSVDLVFAALNLAARSLPALLETLYALWHLANSIPILLNVRL